MSILERILAFKEREIRARKEAMPLRVLESMPYFNRTVNSLKESIAHSDNGIIAEFKRRSPSRPVINNSAKITAVVKGYTEAGVAGISVLTDTHFFGGTTDDLIIARSLTPLPVLRKDFVMDPYQLFEAKAFGADAVLLIAAALDPENVNSLAQTAHSLGLEVLLEVHNEEELTANLDSNADLIGVNNRNLKTFETYIEESERLAPMIPEGVVKISESGIEDTESIHRLKKLGYQGFLIGTFFMLQEKPGEASGNFIKNLRDEN